MEYKENMEYSHSFDANLFRADLSSLRAPRRTPVARHVIDDILQPYQKIILEKIREGVPRREIAKRVVAHYRGDMPLTTRMVESYFASVFGPQDRRPVDVVLAERADDLQAAFAQGEPIEDMAERFAGEHGRTARFWRKRIAALLQL
jgi:hypothetical protein